MSTEHAQFISGDGVQHDVPVDSYAYELMSKDGSFKRVDGPTAVETGSLEEPSGRLLGAGEPQHTPIAELKRPQLVEKAKELGIEFKPNTKNVDLVAAIEAKLLAAEPASE